MRWGRMGIVEMDGRPGLLLVGPVQLKHCIKLTVTFMFNNANPNSDLSFKMGEMIKMEKNVNFCVNRNTRKCIGYFVKYYSDFPE